MSSSLSIADKEKQPNILLFLTDDQDSELGASIEPIPKIRSWIKDSGASFINSFVTIPICCPSRSSLLTGRYQHHTEVWNNSIEGNCWGSDWRSTSEKESLVVQMKAKRNYTTFYAGKYLNQYGEKGDDLSVPEGWDEWAGLVGNSKYYNYKLSINGKLESHGNDYETDYFTDVIKRKALSFLDSYKLKTSNIDESDINPFFMVISNSAPHGPFTPAPQYKNEFSNLSAPRTPAFNYVENVDKQKHYLLRVSPTPLGQDIVDEVDEVFRNRWRALLSVDDQVDEIMRKLQDLDFLDSTFVLFTSDHGYHLGTFAMPWDKRTNYETDLRVPLFVRGPGITAKQEIEDIIVNIDVAPTILDIVGETLDNTDGISFLPTIRSNKISTYYSNPNASSVRDVRDKILITYFGVGMGENKTQPEECQDKCDHQMSNCNMDWGCKSVDMVNNTFACLRTLNQDENSIVCRFKDEEAFVEAYNLNEDPYQLINIAVNDDNEETTNWINSSVNEIEEMIEGLEKDKQ